MVSARVRARAAFRPRRTGARRRERERRRTFLLVASDGAVRERAAGALRSVGIAERDRPAGARPRVDAEAEVRRSEDAALHVQIADGESEKRGVVRVELRPAFA